MKIIAAVYSHPEYYPPTLNAVKALAASIEHVEIVFRNVKIDECIYPNNITLKKSGAFKKIRETETASYFWKLKSFFQFTLLLFHTLKKNRPKWLIVYDPIPLLSYRLISPFLKNKPKLWYHNHDVLEMNRLKKYSISWFSHYSEQRSFSKIDLFTLPSEERKVYFPIQKLKGKYFFLPNYPAISMLKKPQQLVAKEPLKFIYQGHIGIGHGLDNIIKYISKKSRHITLTLIGNTDIDYERYLKSLIEQLNLTNHIKILEPMPYEELILLTSRHHIGLAIHEPINIAFKTAATSSNKIYEYIACGLPVFLFDSKEYKSKLDEKKWAFFTDLSFENLDKNIHHIISHYGDFSESAINDFRCKFHFEKHFANILFYILNKN